MIQKPPIVFMLAVWGESYISKFFNFGLRSLLAPGNIPSMSKEFKCTFLFLITEKDIPFFKAQPQFSLLMSYCQVEFIEISDLIFEGPYSATLTMAFERGMRSRGRKMCDTYFFYLVSDYIMADGSLNNLKHYLERGYSGITAGNFIVVEEYISQKLKTIMDSHEAGILSLNARKILALAFPCLHPVSTAQTVTQSFTHMEHANRLFWKVNEKVMVGRFYLRHMLCIKPEIENYIITSSCDYSFIPEMCPSGNVAHIHDSDEYCVIEMAPFDYDQQYIQSGPFDLQQLSDNLSRWTNAIHRANAHIPVIYHCEEIKELPWATLQSSVEYIEEIESRLSNNPQPIRGHHYWVSCIESILYSLLQKPDQLSKYFYQETFAGVVGSKTFAPVLGNVSDDRFILQISNPPASRPLSKKQKTKARRKAKMMGISPQTSPWHLYWFDDRNMKLDMKEKLTKGPCVIVAFEPIPGMVKWLEENYPGCCSYQYHELFVRRSAEDLQDAFHHKQHAIIFLSEGRLNKLGAAIRQCTKYLPLGSTISVYLKFKKFQTHCQVQQQFAVCCADLLNADVTCENISLHYSLPRIFLQRTYSKFADKSFAPKKKMRTRIIGLMVLCLLNVGCLLGNYFSLLLTKSRKKSSSVTLHFKS